MRLLHTADWHLGRQLHGQPLMQEQAHALDQLVTLARETRPDAVLVAGDVFDRAVPPPEALELLDDVLARLVLDLRLPVVMIAGNHDSPRRLGFAARLLAPGGLRIVGEAKAGAAPLVLDDRHGPLEIHALPYAEPSVVRQALGVEAADHDQALRAQISDLPRDPRRRAVLVAHVFVAGGAPSPDSERPLSVGGAGTVGLDALEGFAYAALGHLHRPQSLGGRARYAGSLLKYSFEEAGQVKSASLVEIDAGGDVEVEVVPLPPLRDLERRRGSMTELLAGPPCAAYLSVLLEDRGALLDPFARLKEVHDGLLHLERPVYAPEAAVGADADGERGLGALFADFFEQVTGAAPSEAERALFEELHDAFRRERREA